MAFLLNYDIVAVDKYLDNQTFNIQLILGYYKIYARIPRKSL